MHEHDKIAQRLGMLLTRLYSGEKLHLSDLATEYNVTVRTLQRDSNQRLSYLPIELHIPADHEHRFRFNVNTISGPM